MLIDWPIGLASSIAGLASRLLARQLETLDVTPSADPCILSPVWMIRWQHDKVCGAFSLSQGWGSPIAKTCQELLYVETSGLARHRALFSTPTLHSKNQGVSCFWLLSQHIHVCSYDAVDLRLEQINMYVVQSSAFGVCARQPSKYAVQNLPAALQTCDLPER